MLFVVREVKARLEWLKGKKGGIRQAETEYSKLGIAKIETTSRHFC
jgi:hypothetical protein